MDPQIKTIEDLSLNAWPSHQIELYDGWLLRFSYFYTHRTNSVEQIGPSSISLGTKITYCEDRYKRWCTPPIFKISPLVPGCFDLELEKRNYKTEHITDVMTLCLDTYQVQPLTSGIRLENPISAEWIEGLFELKGTTNATHRKIVPSMYSAIPKDTIAASMQLDGKIIATGLGILDRSYIGIYAVHVHPAYRGRGLGMAICNALLGSGVQRGAAKAYLQVVQNNAPAQTLYKSLGFETFYTYWFRTGRISY